MVTMNRRRVSAEPQVCSTAVMPMRAPRCSGSAAMVSRVSAAALNRMPYITALFWGVARHVAQHLLGSAEGFLGASPPPYHRARRWVLARRQQMDLLPPGLLSSGAGPLAAVPQIVSATARRRPRCRTPAVL